MEAVLLVLLVKGAVLVPLAQTQGDTVQRFQVSEFRPGQLESTLPALHGQDVFVRMATGSGKSLCMFLVPLTIDDRAMGVVISPLNALMDQQVPCHL